MSKPEANLSAVRTVPIARRPNKVRAEEFATPPAGDRSFSAFLASLPDVLAARDFLALAQTDEVLDKFVADYYKTADANDVLYALEAAGQIIDAKVGATMAQE